MLYYNSILNIPTKNILDVLDSHAYIIILYYRQNQRANSKEATAGCSETAPLLPVCIIKYDSSDKLEHNIFLAHYQDNTITAELE